MPGEENKEFDDELVDYEEEEETTTDASKAAAEGKDAKKSSPWTARSVSWSCATPVSWRSRSLTSTSVSASTWWTSRPACSTEVGRLPYYYGFICAVTYMIILAGVPISQNREALKNNPPHILVGTPGRILGLLREKTLKLDKVKHFVMDECDKMLEAIGTLAAVTLSDAARQAGDDVLGHSVEGDSPRVPQVLPGRKYCFPKHTTHNLCGTLTDYCVKPVTEQPMEIYVDDETKLTLHGLQQYYIKLDESEKNRKLNDLLDALEFNQVVIFVSKKNRGRELNRLLNECNFPSICITADLTQEERIKRYKSFKDFQKRILVTTDLFGRGMDIERVNIVVNYDFPNDSDQYLHRVGRAGRFGTKGLSISFISSEEDTEMLAKVQSRFEVNIPELPDQIDISTYMST
ncbi:unnamed protein product [Phytophthora fragariaefolia]|uniref:RNA helicase n=1 Tax=Phytophthora fragariaefolia TaxID=1490495 RepID=A0A9W6XB56_9STRA|nr:unnamed protein product [Phytophthora fragariaefolia]